MTIHEVLLEGRTWLNHSTTPELDIELLLSSLLSCERTSLISYPEKMLTSEEWSELEKLIEKRQKGMPIAYLTREKEFFGRNFYVDERVLIPRPETEEMVEEALRFLKANPELNTVIDLGTGSGAIAISIAVQSSEFRVYGLDISHDALEVAQINHRRYPCNNLQFIKSDLLSHFPSTLNSEPLTILANLPYIGTETNRFVSDETDRYEPHMALYGGKDGLDLYRRTWEQIRSMKLPVAALFMEIGFSQVETIQAEVTEAFPNYHLTIKNDLAGLPRTATLTHPQQMRAERSEA